MGLIAGSRSDAAIERRLTRPHPSGRDAAGSAQQEWRVPERTPRRRSDERGRHGASQHPGLRVDARNLAIRDLQGAGFVGDRAGATHCIETR